MKKHKQGNTALLSSDQDHPRRRFLTPEEADEYTLQTQAFRISAATHQMVMESYKGFIQKLLAAHGLTSGDWAIDCRTGEIRPRG